jgi:hypothetical protein
MQILLRMLVIASLGLPAVSHVAQAQYATRRPRSEARETAGAPSGEMAPRRPAEVVRAAGELRPRTEAALAARRGACAALVRRLLCPHKYREQHESGPTTLEEDAGLRRSVPERDCGNAGHVPADSPLEITNDVWDPALRSRVLFVRCLRFRDCIPFVLRVQESDCDEHRYVATAIPASPGVKRNTAGSKSVVRAGQHATLVWEQQGLRSTVRVICLERGDLGDKVRVRLLQPSPKVLLAVVVSPTLLRSPL